ncbi:acyl-CoA dehydrogenase family protein, partial [Mycobacterium kansasii]
TEALAEGIARSRDTDYLDMEALLSDEEKDLLVKVRKFGDKELLPIVNDYWERGEFPFEIVPKLRELKIVGDTMTGYGITPMTAVGQ